MKRYVISFISAALVMIITLLLVSCDRTPSLSPLGPDAVILAFGDSLTAGTGAGEGESYPAVLARMSGRRVINAGVPGEISAEGVRRLPELLDNERPALLVLCHGGNDLLRRMDQTQLAGNLRTMVRAARERGVSVVLVAVPSLGLSLKPPPLYREVADEFALPLQESALQHILGKNGLKSDHVHPNAAGYRKLAEDISALLVRSGALSR